MRKKWRSVATKKTEMSRYLSENTKTGDFKQQRTLFGLFFVIPEHLGSIRAVVLAFTTNKQANKHSQLYNTSIDARLRRASLLWRVVDGVSAKVL